LNNQTKVILTSQVYQKSSLVLLDYLEKKFRYLDRTEWEQRLESGQVLVNDRPASAGQPLRAGDTVTYATTAWKEPEVNPNYKTVYEDEALLVLSKPSPLPVHGIGAYFQNTLMHLLRRDRPEAAEFNLVHRLDRETSGVLLLSKKREYLKPLQHQWLEGRVQKTYWGLVFGTFAPGPRQVEAAIGPKRGSRIRMKMGVDHVAGKASVTTFRGLETRKNISLVESSPETGRTHQIRVHLEALGYPLVGDKIYAGNDEVFLDFIREGWTKELEKKIILPRLALHAHRLELTHPVSGKPLVLEDPLPDDLADFWNNL
jgi:RluA family pseudouridine synthase